jgi:hypothetical protein
MNRIGWLLAALALAGCAEFNTTLQEPELLQAHDAQRAAIQAGKTTRAEVRELLGEPWLQSESWGFELYTLSDQRRDVWWMMAPLLPVPVGAFKREVNAHTLIAWHEDGIVAASSSGTVVNGAVDEDSMLIRSEHLTLVVGFDDYPPLVRWPAFSPWHESGNCRYNPDCCRSTLVYPFDLAPGNHRLQLRTGYPLCKGAADIEFSCAPGQVLFARLCAEEQRQRRDCNMTLTAEFVDELPPEWAGRSIVLWSNGNWIAANQ